MSRFEPVVGRHALRRTLFELDLLDDAAEAIRRYEGWTQPVEWARARLLQTLSDRDTRKLSLDWALILVRLIAYHGGEDRLTPLFQEAAFDGRMAREREAELLPMPRRGPVRAGGRSPSQRSA